MWRQPPRLSGEAQRAALRAVRSIAEAAVATCLCVQSQPLRAGRRNI